MRDMDGAEAMLASIQSRATRHETPGGVVWHAWGQGPPIVMLHGAAGSWRHWLHNVLPLAARHQVLCADMPGYGDSAMPPGPVTLESFADMLVDGIEALIPRTPFALVGFSLGATIAGQIAHMMGERVTRLILQGSGGLTPANFVEMKRPRRVPRWHRRVKLSNGRSPGVGRAGNPQRCIFCKRRSRIVPLSGTHRRDPAIGRAPP